MVNWLLWNNGIGANEIASFTISYCICSSCNIAECESATYAPDWLPNAIPHNRGIPAKCLRYEYTPTANNSIVDIDDHGTCAEDQFDRTKIYQCDVDQLVYKTDEVSIVNEVNSIAFIFTSKSMITHPLNVFSFIWIATRTIGNWQWWERWIILVVSYSRRSWVCYPIASADERCWWLACSAAAYLGWHDHFQQPISCSWCLNFWMPPSERSLIRHHSYWQWNGLV